MSEDRVSLDEYGGTGIDDCLEAENEEDQRSTNPINNGEEQQSESQLEEEIALQETILESLQIRLHSLDKDIDRYMQGIDLSTQVIEDAQSKESQLIKKKNEHMMILKKVKQNYEKCILALKKKLDMKPDCIVEDVPLQEQVITAEEAIEDIQTLHENEENEEQIIENPFLQFSVEIVDPFDDEYIKKRWNQSAPSKMPVFQLQNTKLPPLMMTSIPLHAPIRSKEKLSDIIRIMHSEIRARRKKISSQIELEADYDFFIKGTVLDFYAMSLYNPFVFEKLQSDCPMAKKIWDSISVVEEQDEDEKETRDEEREIDPHVIICRDDLFGNCDDVDCLFQHIGNQMKKKSDWRKLEKLEKRKLNYINLPVQAFPIPSLGSNFEDCSVDVIGSSDEKQGFKRKFLLDQKLEDVDSIECKRPKCNMDSSSLTDKDFDYEQNHETDTDGILETKKATFPLDLESGDESPAKESNTSKEEVLAEETSPEEESDDIIGNEDFILLPTIDIHEDTHDIASRIENALEQCDNDEIESNLYSKAQQSPSAFMTTLTDALKNIGFELSEDNCLSYTNEIESITNIDQLDTHIYFLKLTSNVIYASKICVHACRVDIADAILKLYKIFIESRKDTNSLENQILFGKIHLSLSSFVEGSTCGRASSSPSSIFHIQLYFSAILRAMNCLIEEEIDLALSAEYEYDAVSSSNSVAITQNIDLYTEIFTREYRMEDRSLKSILLEVKSIQPLSSNLDSKDVSLRQQNSILLGNLLSKAVCDESFHMEDPQLLVENVLSKLCSILKTFSFKSHQIATSIDEEAKQYLQFEVFALFGPAIITTFSCIASALLSENMGFRVSRRNPSPRTESILAQLKNYGMETIHYLDFSGVTRGNLCGQSLLAPFFAILNTVLVATRSYSKAHVLLTTALLPKHEECNWMIFSDLLWSSLLQLHISFPHKNAHDWRYRNSLLGPLTTYDIHLSMITVVGDGYLSNCIRLKGQLGKTNKMRGNKKQKKKDHDAIEKNCILVASDDYMNVENIDCRLSVKFINHPPRPYPSEQIPLSIFLFSQRLSVLEFSGASMKYLPETFGLYFPNLMVSLKVLPVKHLLS